jgi:hypothetical protein
MKPARLFSLIVLMMLAVYGAIAFYLLPYANFNGDLTRIGMLPEHLFGWRKPEPAISPDLMKQASWQNADVLVVGDSFSEGRVWQSVLTSHGLRVRTESWTGLRAVCTDFESWLAKQGFHGRIVVFEMVERNIPDIDRSIQCTHMFLHHGPSTDLQVGPPLTSLDPDQRYYSGRLSVGLETAFNAYRYEQISNKPGFRQMNLKNGARLVRIPDGCSLFSHLNCKDVLFLDKDKAADIPDSVLDKVEQIDARFSKITPIWMFVPNKSTPYLYPGKRFWDKAEQRVNAPNLLQLFRTAIANRTVDLYYGNNTHLSTNGYLLMGQALYRDIRSQLKDSQGAGKPKLP